MSEQSWGRTLLVVNPAAHNAEAAQVKDGVFSRVSSLEQCVSLEMMLTTEPGHARTMAAEIDGFDTVLALGGDGLIHELVNGLMERRASERMTLGVIPFGSGNDYARTLGMPLALDKALVSLGATHKKMMDVGVCNGEYFCETLSFGLDAAIALDTVERRRRTGKTGTALYAASGFDQLRNHRDVHVAHVSFDGEAPRTIEVHLIAVQIGKTYGGGFCICPDADPTDGIFDTCVAYAPLSLVGAGVTFALAKGGHHVGRKGIQVGQARTVEVSFDSPIPTQIDGEKMESTSYRVRGIRQPLPVLSVLA